jgi:hypothetical protein
MLEILPGFHLLFVLVRQLHHALVATVVSPGNWYMADDFFVWPECYVEVGVIPQQIF